MGVMFEAGALGLLGQEWVTLQNNHAHHERVALALKLATVVLAVVLLVANFPPVVVGVVVLLLSAPFQLHSQWQAQRTNSLGLLREYALNACRPTVAYPYAVIVLGLAALTVFR